MQCKYLDTQRTFSLGDTFLRHIIPIKSNKMRAPSSMGRGRGGRGGRGVGGRGGRDEGPPSVVVEVGQLMHECESEMVCKLTEKESKIPHFNAGIFLENKKKIGKVGEVSFTFIDGE